MSGLDPGVIRWAELAIGSRAHATHVSPMPDAQTESHTIDIEHAGATLALVVTSFAVPIHGSSRSSSRPTSTETSRGRRSC